MATPAYTNACIAPDASGLNVYLLGVPVSNEGRLEMYSVSLTNINSPTATFISNYTSTAFWSSSAQKVCFAYTGNSVSNSPIMIFQMGDKPFATNFFPNGTVEDPGYFRNLAFTSRKLFSFTGAAKNFIWATGFSNVTDIDTGSSWRGLRFNASDIRESTQDWGLTNYPTNSPLLSLGTYVATQNTPAQGYHVVFDEAGSGVIYTALSTATPLATTVDHVQTLSSPQDVDMSGYSLSKHAVPVTIVNVGYILDRAPDGSVILYSITPGQSSKLQFISVSGSAPSFSSNMAAAAVGGKIVIYGASNNGAASFNSFDPTSKSWIGPGLMKAYNPPTPSGGNGGNNTISNDGEESKSNVGAIAGGVVGGLVVIALIAFIFFRRRPKPPHTSTVQSQSAPVHHDPSKQHNPAATPLMDQNYVLQQQQLAQNQEYQHQQQIQQQQMQQQQQQYTPHQSYIPQQQNIYTSQPIPVQQQTSPVFFQSQPQAQESYSYVPPTLVPQQQQQPAIFQPQTSQTSPQNSYTQASYTQSTPQTAYTQSVPQTPASQSYTPISQSYTPAHSSHAPSGPQYIAPSGDYAP
ncbi:hypothetical protein BGX27_006264 [Mortierella sp. AM989]|nr:hypothetical protein BGX27_006264 [Mortierella sp. AM989]